MSHTLKVVGTRGETPILSVPQLVGDSKPKEYCVLSNVPRLKRHSHKQFLEILGYEFRQRLVIGLNRVI